MYWNDILSALAGDAYGYDTQTGARIDTPSPEWTAAVQNLPPEIQAQAGENWTAQHRNDEFSGFVGNVFGNIFTPAALTAVGFMGGNAIAQLVGAGGSALGGTAGAVGAADVGGSIAPLAATPGLTAPAGGAVGLTALGAPAAGAAALGGGSMGTGLGPLAMLLGPSILQGGLGLIGAGIGAGAAKDAASTQAEAAREANWALLGMYGQNRADMAPYREAGYGALGQLGVLAQQPAGYYPYESPATLDPNQYGFDPNQYAFDPSQHAFDPNQYAFDGTQHRFDP